MARKFAFITLLVVLLGPLAAFADDDDDDNKLSAVPFVFVGTAEECGGTAGARIVTSAWLGGMGLPDNGGNNFGTTPSDPPNKKDPHLGLLLNKNGATPICSSAGAEIKGVKGMEVTAGFHLGFDYRNGSHCSGGSPRFNVSYRKPDNTDGFSFVGGCGNDSTPTDAPQDPDQWSQVRFETSNAGESFPIIPTGSRIASITLIMDEGTDTPTAARPSTDAGNPAGIGLAVVDNIDINDRLITRGSGIADGIDRYKEKDNDKHDD